MYDYLLSWATKLSDNFDRVFWTFVFVCNPILCTILAEFKIEFKSSTWAKCILCFWLRSLSPSNYVCTVISTSISSWRKILESADNIIFLAIVHVEYAFISLQVTRNRKSIVTVNIYSGINAIYNLFYYLAML